MAPRRIQNTSYTVVGVTPRAFTGEWVGKPVDLWIPAAMQAQVRFFFGNQNPVGRHFGRNGQAGTAIEIVGVARNAKQETPRRDKDRMLFYVPYRQDTGRLHSMCLVARATGNPLALPAAFARRSELSTTNSRCSGSTPWKSNSMTCWSRSV